MSDLTREVLEEQERAKRVFDDASVEEGKFGYVCYRAAPVLARQVEAIEALADRLDRLARERDEAGDFCLAGAVGTDAARIRRALRDAEKEANR